MKYGESIFDCFYIFFMISSSLYLFCKGKSRFSFLMGISTFILGFGDSFHLVPRILQYFVDGDLTFFLGMGKLITSITMTIFYLLLFFIYQENYSMKKNKMISLLVWCLCLLRVVLCLLPGNRWIFNDSPFFFTILRNIPFFFLGFLIIILFYRVREKDSIFRFMWFLISLSFFFYALVILFSSKYPLFGMFMLPKTICYMGIVSCFIRKVQEEK